MSEAVWQRWRWTAAAGAAVALALLAFFAFPSAWEFVGVYPMPRPFADLVAILASGEADVAGQDVYRANPIDPFGRPHVYGPLWLVTGRLGLEVADAAWVGALLAAAFVVAALLLVGPRTASAAAVTAALLLSPPVLLGLERANNDLVIFLLLALAGAVVARAPRGAALSAAGAVVLAAALKYYPLAAVGALAARDGRLRRALGIGAACVAAFALLMWWQRDGVGRSLAVAPRPATIFAYGAPLLGYGWTGFADFRPWLLLGGGISLAAAGLAVGPVAAKLWTALPLIGTRTACAVAGGLSWLVCYAATPNYHYRAVLLLLVLPAWLGWAGESEIPERRRLARGLCALFLAAAWLAAPKLWWHQVLVANGPDAERAARWMTTVFATEQVLWLALSACVAAMLAGWGWRRFRAGPL